LTPRSAPFGYSKGWLSCIARNQNLDPERQIVGHGSCVTGATMNRLLAAHAVGLCAAAVLLLSSSLHGAEGGVARPLSDADASAGQALYISECSACHGERGDGQGPAADFLEPRPRDFTKKIFKVRSTDSGAPPRTEDVLRTIELGFPGTAMPAFSFLGEQERRQIAAYVLQLAGLLHEPEPAAMSLPANPPPQTPQSIARGKQAYQDAECFSCHGRKGRGDGPAAATLKDVDGRAVPPRDLTSGDFRGGSERIDLYQRIVTGMDGSPMPSYAAAIEEADRWALVDYVLALSAPSKGKTSRAPAATALANRTGCRGCHVLGDGKGGPVGPDLRFSARKLRADWIEQYLRHTHDSGVIYPASPYRMPDMRLTDDEIRVLTAFIVKLGKRARAPAPPPDVARFPPEKVEAGKIVFASHCAACHALDANQAGAGTPRGPDLTPAFRRLDFEWSQKWLAEHRAVAPSTSSLGDGDLEAAGMFVWRTSAETAASQRAASR
jgi:mono/diheme cytochrome c family protein